MTILDKVLLFWVLPSLITALVLLRRWPNIDKKATMPLSNKNYGDVLISSIFYPVSAGIGILLIFIALIDLIAEGSLFNSAKLSQNKLWLCLTKHREFKLPRRK